MSHRKALWGVPLLAVAAFAAARANDAGRPSIDDLIDQLENRSCACSVEAGRQLSDKIAAVRAIGRIAGPQAREILAAYASDPDVGHVVRKVLRDLATT